MSEADRKTILIVDDEVKMANAACALLNDAGYEASSAASAKEALALLLEYPAHMVIADLHMPDVDGVALLKGVREIDANIIRMIITEQPGPEATKALAEADIQQVIAKPWDDAELTEIVRSAFEQTASQEMEMQGLHRIISEIDSLPPVPSVYAELSQITQDAENASADEVTRIINQDPAIAAKILQIANSAYFGQQREVATVSNAVVVLGMGMVETLVLATSVFQTFESGADSGLDQEGFWKHCLGCGMAASLLERKITKDRSRAEVAMLAGTLHDLGKLVLAQYMPERYAEVVSMARVRRMMLCDEEEEMLGTTHAAVGGHLAQWWNLPEAISEALSYHHEPQESAGDTRLTAFVHLADVIVHRAQIGSSGCGVEPDIDTQLQESLGIKDSTLAAVQEQITSAAG